MNPQEIFCPNIACPARGQHPGKGGRKPALHPIPGVCVAQPNHKLVGGWIVIHQHGILDPRVEGCFGHFALHLVHHAFPCLRYWYPLRGEYLEKVKADLLELHASKQAQYRDRLDAR